MAESKLMLDSTFLTLAASASWTLPAAQWVDSRKHLNAGLLIDVQSFKTSASGTLAFYLQSSPSLSQDNNGWTDLASVTGVSATGPQILFANFMSTNMVTGYLRLRVACSTGAVDFTIRAELLMQYAVAAELSQWLKPTLISFSAAGDLVMPADLWAPCAQYLHAWLLCDYQASFGSGSNLTVALQTAPSADADENSWLTVASATMGNTAAVIAGPVTATNPIMGVLRLKYTASAALGGTLQVQLLLKEM
jgi:hypothetical protein